MTKTAMVMALLREQQQQTPMLNDAEVASRIPPTEPTLWDLVVVDMKGRDAFGFKKYSRHLAPNDGRDTLRDAYEEALDLAVYLRKALHERDGR